MDKGLAVSGLSSQRVGTVFLRSVKANGVKYVQLAQNEWVDGNPSIKAVHGFGREERLDQEAVKRLVNSISRFLDPDDAALVRRDLGLDTVRVPGRLAGVGAWVG